jgi:hypothetical protein
MSASKQKSPAGIVWFEIAVDNVKRAKEMNENAK